MNREIAIRRAGALFIGMGLILASASMTEACGFRASGRINVARAARQSKDTTTAQAAPAASAGTVISYKGGLDAAAEAEAKKAGITVAHASDPAQLNAKEFAGGLVVAQAADAAAVRAAGLRVIPVATVAEVPALQGQGYAQVLNKGASAKDKANALRAALGAAPAALP